MCLVKAVIRSSSAEPVNIADIVDLSIDGDTVRLRTLFGESHEFHPARLTQADFGRNILFISKESP